MTTINAYDYGLREDASAATNTAAINAAVAALRRVTVRLGDANTFTPAIFHIPPGAYNIAEKSPTSRVGIDFSMLRVHGHIMLDCRGAVLITDSTLADKVVFDLLGSRWVSGFLPAIHTPHDPLLAPLTGIQFGRYHNDISAGEHHFTDVKVRGYFTRTCVHNFSAETCVFTSPMVMNYFDAADAHAWIQDGWTHWLPESDAKTSLTRDEGRSFLMNSFFGGFFRASGRSNGISMHLGRTRQHVFKNCYFVSSGLTTVEVAGEADGLRFPDSHFESIIQHCLRFTSIGGSTAFVAQGLSFHEVRANARASIFGIDPALSTVEIRDFDCSIHRFNSPLKQGVFEDASKVSILGGRIFLEKLTYWKTPAVFHGDLITPSSIDHYGERVFKDAPAAGRDTQAIKVANGAAAEIALPADSALLVITTPNANSAAALVWVRQNNSRIIVQSGRYATKNRTKLTGTTGEDKHTTIGVAGKTIHIENRMGGAREYCLSFLANG